jgi:probable FeS assembly SUF system protein SufT
MTTAETAVKLPDRDRRRLPDPVQAILVPAGTRAEIPAGTVYTITHVLGGAATIELDDGRLARLGPTDSQRLGLVSAADVAPSVDAAAASFTIEAVWDALRQVYDPEIPVDIVELGLVYRCEATELADGTQAVDVDMSVTAPFCGMGDVLRQDAIDRITALPGIGSVEVELVLDPPWDVSRLSEAARLELGML